MNKNLNNLFNNTLISNNKSESLNTNTNINTSWSYSIMKFITKYDSLFIISGVIFLILIAILISAFFQQAKSYRHNVLFNNGLAIIMGIFFVYLVLSFMGHQVKFFMFSFDFGLLLFLTMAIFVIFVLGD